MKHSRPLPAWKICSFVAVSRDDVLNMQLLFYSLSFCLLVIAHTTWSMEATTSQECQCPLNLATISCSSKTEGAVRYTNAKKVLEFCSKLQWHPVSSSIPKPPPNPVSPLGSQQYPGLSCKAIAGGNRLAKNGVFWIKPNSTQNAFKAYCDIQAGGWTLIIKMNGGKNTFKYDSYLWTSKQPFNHNRWGLDYQEAKYPGYWTLPFREVRLGMRRHYTLRWINFPYSGNSLHSVIAYGQERRVNIGRYKWQSLLSGSSLQNNCCKEGFNIKGSWAHVRVRIGIVGNNEYDCNSVDSFIGFGGQVSPSDKRGINTCGNIVQCCGRCAISMPWATSLFVDSKTVNRCLQNCCW
ncbi:uncharacterized skeletal organic matrix protein 5-like [Corticium candelabrum]|uniref:uncharacterized skeletal organic matrix protein 5-like n=1 Tax=Corticium candelabrum TaxID=121492 RepID=UPI002E25F0DE|nr:uncharacterized skeletal organic matrix protein 5-like [Corticium candelabrum]